MSLVSASTSFKALYVLRTVFYQTSKLSPRCSRFSTTTAASATSTTARKSSSPSLPSPNSTNPNPDLLSPSIPTSSLSLPLQSLSSPLPTINPIRISREELHRLHRLSALNPPPPDSVEEKELIDGLAELIGLMELVKGVELPDGREGREELLGLGVGEVLIDEEDVAAVEVEQQREGEREDGAGLGAMGDTGEEKFAEVAAVDGNGDWEKERKRGRELLEYATNRIGDYYASGLEKRKE